MKLFIIGGTGFLGSYLVSKLKEKHYDVTVLSRNAEKNNLLTHQGIHCITGDILQPGEFMNETGPFDLVVMIAMPPFKPGPVSHKKFNRLRETTTQFVRNSLLLAEKWDCPLMLTYGTSFKTKEGETADESFPIARFGMARMGEHVDTLINDVKKKGSIPLIEMLPGQIYGPGGLSLKMIDMARRGRGATFGDGSNRIPRIHVEDCAEAYAKAIGLMPLNNRFIISDDYACTTKEFNDYIGNHYGVKKQRKIPIGIFKLIAGKLIYETVTMDCCVTNAKAKDMLEWELKYPTYKEGLDATFAILDKVNNK